MESLYQEYKDRGFMLISLMGELEDGTTDMTPDDLTRWADTYGITHPVLADPEWGYGWTLDTDYSLAMPSSTLLAPGAIIEITDGFELTGADFEEYLPD